MIMSENFRILSGVKGELAVGAVAAVIVTWEIDGGQAPRQPGQVRKEAAVTSSGLGRSLGLPLISALPG